MSDRPDMLRQAGAPGRAARLMPAPALLAGALALAALAAQARPEGPWPAALLFLALFAPLGLVGGYFATLRRIRNLSAFADGSLVRRHLAGTWIRLIFAWLLAAAAAAAVAVRLVGFERVDILLLAATVPIFGLCWLAVRPRLYRELKPVYRRGGSLWLAALLAAAIMVCLDAGARLAQGGVAEYASLAAAIAAAKSSAGLFGDSALAALVAEAAGLWAGLEAYALGLMAAGGAASGALALMALGNGVFYFTVCLYLAGFLIPWADLARAIAPVSDADAPPGVTRGRVLSAAAVAALLVFLAYPAAVHFAEQALREGPQVQTALKETRQRLERIDDALVGEGTIAKIEQARRDVAGRRDVILAGLSRELDAGFGVMRGNVDAYLDWYYSLPAEYGRLARFVTGGLDSYMAAKVEETLGAGDPFAGFEAALSRAALADAVAAAGYRRAVKLIVERNRAAPGRGRSVEITGEAALSDLLVLPESPGLTTVSQRLGLGVAAGGAAGAVTGVIAGRAAARMLGKGTIRAAARALARVAAGRAASGLSGAATGAAAGAAAGSVVPLFGTAIGATVGGIVGGLAVGLGTDYLILELEETFGRENHKQDILARIDATHDALKAQLAAPGAVAATGPGPEAGADR